MSVALNATTTAATLLENITTKYPAVDPVLIERERIRMEFYQTYDMMTGIRIAATLGSFFTMMVLLVLYKSKCKSRADESLEAAITAVVAEEEELEAVLNQSKYNYNGHGHRQSLGNMSAPAYTRFSSVGGYGGLMNPPSRRYDRGTRGRVSLPTSDISFRYFTSAPTSISSQEQRSPHLWKSYNEEEENDLEEVEENEDVDDTKFLQVPNSRCKFNANSNSDPFYFDRRGSCSRAECFSGLNKEFKRSFNHPNIQVIQATPQISPSESSSGLQDDQHPQTANAERKLAPLASIGSCSALSSIESENRSVGSDSVFITNETVEEDDTDKDQNEEELSSAKSDQDCTNKKYRIVSTPRHNSCFVISSNRIQSRRFSDSGMLDASVDRANVSLFPIVTNLATNASNQTTTSLYDRARPTESSSSSTSLSSNFSCSISTSSDKQRKGIFSRIAIIDAGKSPAKNERLIKMKLKSQLSRSEPKTMNTFLPDHSAGDLKTLSLKNLLSSGVWSKETLF